MGRSRSRSRAGGTSDVRSSSVCACWKDSGQRRSPQRQNARRHNDVVELRAGAVQRGANPTLWSRLPNVNEGLPGASAPTTCYPSPPSLDFAEILQTNDSFLGVCLRVELRLFFRF